MNSPSKHEIYFQESTNEELDKNLDNKFEKVKQIKLRPLRDTKFSKNLDKESSVAFDPIEQKMRERIKNLKDVEEITSDNSSDYFSSRSITDVDENDIGRVKQDLNSIHVRIPHNLKRRPTYDPLKLITPEMRLL